ncbi:uncharacterized protein LOC143027185 isoform X2 [Oratosquilla oratoria]
MSKTPRKKIHFFNRGLTLPEDGRADEGQIPELVPLSPEISRSHEDLRDCANMSPQTPRCSSDLDRGDSSGATQQDQPVLWENESCEENRNSEYERTRKIRMKSNPSLFKSQEDAPSERGHTTQNMINFSVEKILSSELCKGVYDKKNDTHVKDRRTNDTGSGSPSNAAAQDKGDPQFDETFRGILARRLVSGGAGDSGPGTTGKLKTDEAGFGALSPQLLNDVSRNSVVSAFSCVGRLAVVGLRTHPLHPLTRKHFELPMDAETNPPPTLPARVSPSGTTNAEILQGNNSDGGQKESSAAEASLSHRKKRRCRLCMNHNIDVDMKGHKHRCTYLNCPCDACTITRKGRLYMKKQLALTRFQQQTLMHNARKAMSANEGDNSSSARERQPYPGIGDLERETKDVIDFSLLEKINSKYPNL